TTPGQEVAAASPIVDEIRKYVTQRLNDFLNSKRLENHIIEVTASPITELTTKVETIDPLQKQFGELAQRLSKAEQTIRQTRIDLPMDVIHNFSETIREALADKNFISALATEARAIRNDIITAEQRITGQVARYEGDINAHGHAIDALQAEILDLRSSTNAELIQRIVTLVLLRIADQLHESAGDR
ncbi:MAG: hypothetical protein H0U76_27385, partial [Ktedonobacteraceae bacterium]|nr:hypothetical protein [Ktedonobacteraceae bacterium]MBA3825784.1 hypothetical protein [Ktedonobacterales bacterium]